MGLIIPKTNEIRTRGQHRSAPPSRRTITAGSTLAPCPKVKVMASKGEDKPANLWVLDTHTKGTGANMVPLERVLKHGSDTVPGFVLPERRRPEPGPAEPRKPYRFKVVDLMTRQALADDVNARTAVEVLGGVRSIVDVTVYVWDDADEGWRRLTFGETKALWDQRAT